MPNTQDTIISAGLSPNGQLFLGGTQADITSGSTVLVGLNTIETGFTDAIEDTANNKITPGVAGLYLITAQVYFMNILAPKHFFVWVKKNGSTKIIDKVGHSGIVAGFPVLLSKPVPLSNTDYVGLYAQQECGINTVDIYGGSEKTFLSVIRIA